MAAANPFELDPLMDEDPMAEEAPAAPYVEPGADLEEETLEMEDAAIISLLNSYFEEAENARETGFEPRHQVWEENLHAFWMRREYADKQSWQAQEKSSYVPSFATRFAATQREALTQNPDWVSVKDRVDPTNQLGKFAAKFTRLLLDFCGTNESGQPIAFEHEFGQITLTGTVMKMCAAVTYDRYNHRVVVVPKDPRQVLRDPTGRGLYRVEFYETDKETLLRMADLVDDDGNPLYDKDAIEQLVAVHDMDVVQNQEIATGAGSMLSSPRTPVLIKEWLVDLIDKRAGDGSGLKVREKQYIVTANDHTIIRGPEPNPYWHGKDWIVDHAMLAGPIKSVDGRTYVESFRHAVETHENVTNRILDAVATSSMNAFEVNPDLLDDPTAIENGIAPNMAILRADDAPPGERAVQSIALGNSLGADIMNVWNASKKEAQEAGGQSDLSLGQLSRGETTATEISASDKGQSSLSDSISIDIDLGFLGPLAELVYYTGLQHADEQMLGVWDGLSPEEQAMLASKREEFRDRPILVKATGLTNAVRRSRRVRGMLGALNVIGGNPLLVQAFQQEYSLNKLIEVIFEDFGVQTDRIALSEEEKFQMQDKMRQEAARQKAMEAMGGAMPGGPGGGAGGGGEGAPAQMASALGGADPAGAGVPEGLPGGVQ